MAKKFLILILILLLGIVPVWAQDETSPLLKMLEHIPDSAGAREWLTYVDYPALFSARPGVSAISSWAEFESILSGGGDEQGRLASALMSLNSGPSDLLSYLQQFGEMPALVGFDWFQIQQAAEFGMPPDAVLVLQGDFDTTAIAAAHEARDYTQTEAGDLLLLCPAAGCDSGNMINIAARNAGNPFGGNLGRSQAVLAGDHLVASSPRDVALNSVAEAVAGTRDSLADQPDYRAAAEALSASGTILQSYFIPALEISSVTEALISSRMTQEQIDAIRERLETDFLPLPLYNLVVLAHTVTEDEQQAQVALVYRNAEDAQAAADLFPARIENYTSLVMNQPFMSILTERGVTEITTSIHESTSSRFTLLITLHSPLPSVEPDEETGRFQAIGLPYALLVNAYIQRDLGWLASVL